MHVAQQLVAAAASPPAVITPPPEGYGAAMAPWMRTICCLPTIVSSVAHVAPEIVAAARVPRVPLEYILDFLRPPRGVERICRSGARCVAIPQRDCATGAGLGLGKPLREFYVPELAEKYAQPDQMPTKTAFCVLCNLRTVMYGMRQLGVRLYEDADSNIPCDCIINNFQVAVGKGQFSARRMLPHDPQHFNGIIGDVPEFRLDRWRVDGDHIVPAPAMLHDTDTEPVGF